MSNYIDISTSSLNGNENINHYHTDYSLDTGSNRILVHNQINHLYYSAFNTSSGTVDFTSSYDNFIETSFTSASRKLNDKGALYSIPRKKFGTHIEPLTVVVGNEEIQYIVNQDNYIDPNYFAADGTIYLDDGEGNLRSGSITGEKVGNVIYSHGQIIFTNESIAATLEGDPAQQISWKSNVPIYTYTYNIKLSDYEYNYTFNPTAQSGSYLFDNDGEVITTPSEHTGSRYLGTTGILADNVTGSYFTPYITTVGLYNDANELIAVGKLAQPLPKSADTETTIQIKLDI